MRARARAYMEAFRARTERFEVVYASKAFPAPPPTGCSPRRGCPRDVAIGGELHLALAGGIDPKRIYMHGNNKTHAELDYALERGVGHIVVDSFDEIERLRGPRPARAPAGHARASSPRTHSYIQTGQADSKFGFPLGRRAARGRGAAPTRGSSCAACTRTSARRSSTLEAFERLAEVLAGHGRLAAAQPRRRARHRLHRGGRPAERSRSTSRRCCATRPEDVTVLCEPGRSLVGNAGVTLYTRGHRQAHPGRAHLRRRRRRHVRQPAPDALRRPLRGRDRRPFGGADAGCTIAGMHCESGDVLVRDVHARRPAARATCSSSPPPAPTGTRWRTTTTRCRGPPVIFCRDGDARVVVRRETFDDLTLRDV